MYSTLTEKNYFHAVHATTANTRGKSRRQTYVARPIVTTHSHIGDTSAIQLHYTSVCVRSAFHDVCTIVHNVTPEKEKCTDFNNTHGQGKCKGK